MIKIMRARLKKSIVFVGIIIFFTACQKPDVPLSGGSHLISNANFVEIKELPDYDSYGFIKSDYIIEEHRVKRNDSFYVILSTLGVSPQTIFDLQHAAKEIFPMRNIQPNQRYYTYSDADTGEIKHLVFQNNALDYAVFDWSDEISVKAGRKKLVKEMAAASGVIKTSLYEALAEQEVNVLAANRLSEIFGWQIDFFRLYPGDEYRLIYEKQFVEERPYGIGDILAAEFTHQGKSYYAFMYNNGDKTGYYDEHGNSVQKALLKAPFTYSHRISSGFSANRFHPVLQENRPHYGIDYAAPLNTPVIAVGDGEVLEAQYRGANGNIVRIRHNSVYTTAYLHLNGFAKGVRKGATVKQGQVIGYVGRTGRVTGVHLDYRVYKNGSPVNPLRLELPPAEGIADDKLDAYKTFIAPMLDELEGLSEKRQVLALSGLGAEAQQLIQ